MTEALARTLAHQAECRAYMLAGGPDQFGALWGWVDCAIEAEMIMRALPTHDTAAGETAMCSTEQTEGEKK
jgi:hypothetical protein